MTPTTGTTTTATEQAATEQTTTGQTTTGQTTTGQATTGQVSTGQVSTGRNWRDAFTREEIRDLHRIDDWRAWATLAVNWGLIAAAFAAAAQWPNPLVIVAALFVIGARQLGMAVVMHEASHRTFLKNKRMNDWVGNWLAAYPVWSDLEPYRPYHLQHHAKNWTEEDPDLDLAAPFPITRQSFKRKVWRDLSGQTGYKRFRATLRRDLSISNGKSKRSDDSGRKALAGVAATNLALLAILAATGHAWLYLLWIGAWFTTYSLVMRIRAIAEHSMVRDPANPFDNARTTEASWLERLLLAPNRVNYHLEHHLLMAVPHYKLPRFHRMLSERGLLDGANVVRGYRGVLSLASSKPAAA